MKSTLNPATVAPPVKFYRSRTTGDIAIPQQGGGNYVIWNMREGVIRLGYITPPQLEGSDNWEAIHEGDVIVLEI